MLKCSPMACPSILLSVRYAQILYQNDASWDHDLHQDSGFGLIKFDRNHLERKRLISVSRGMIRVKAGGIVLHVNMHRLTESNF